MPKHQIKTQHANNQQEDSYEQQIFEHDQNSSPKDQSPQAMLDQNDQFEIYDDESPSNYNKNNFPKAKTQHLSKIQHSHLNLNEDRQSSSIDFGLSDLKNLKQQHEQPDTDLQEETQKVAQLLKNNYSHLDQDILIQMLYDKCFPKNVKAQPIDGINQRNNLENIKQMTRTVRIFVQHGYGINIARKFAQKGQHITPNPYNNNICKIIKETWKGIENEISKIRKSIRPLNTSQFNQIKTPLINARQWMEKYYLEIFLSIVAYTNGLKSVKPSSKDFENLYDFLIPKTKSGKQTHEKQKSKKSREKSRYDESSEEFKVPKHYEKKIVYGKPPKPYVKKHYDD